jgi:hypothetical protein
MGRVMRRVTAGVGAVSLLVLAATGIAAAQISGVELTPRCGDAANQLHAKSTRGSGINAIVTGFPGDVDLGRLNLPAGDEATKDVGKFDEVNVNSGREQQRVASPIAIRLSPRPCLQRPLRWPLLPPLPLPRRSARRWARN